MIPTAEATSALRAAGLADLGVAVVGTDVRGNISSSRNDPAGWLSGHGSGKILGTSIATAVGG
jgi:hypothetical protein